MEVKHVLLKDLVDFETSRKILAKDIQEHQGIYPVYSSKFTGDYVFGYIDTYDFEGEYITYTISGTKAGGVLYNNEKFSANSDCAVLKIKDPTLISYFFLKEFLFLTLPLFIPQGAARPRISKQKIENIKVPVPPMEYQQIVAELADEFDSLLSPDQGSLKKEHRLNSRRRDHYFKLMFQFSS